MIDSINYIVYGIGKLDLQRLTNLGIVYHKLKYKKNQYGKYYIEYGNIKEETDISLVSKGIEFEYNNIHFLYLQKFSCIILIANAHAVLQCNNIKLSYRDKYIRIVKETVAEVLGLNYSRLYLHRIDFCVDLKLDYQLMYEYLQLLYKHKRTYQNIKRINEYETSLYLTSKHGQKRINIYDKCQCEKDKHPKDPNRSLCYSNIFRIEVQNTKVLIQNKSIEIVNKYDNRSEAQKEIDKLLKRLNEINILKARKSKLIRDIERKANMSIYDNLNNNYPKKLLNISIEDLEIEAMTIELMIEDLVEQESDKICKSVEMDFNDKLLLNKDLCAYWNQESMNTYYFEFLKDFLYEGIYYKLRIAEKKIEETEEYTNCQKKHLKEFIKAVNKHGISGVITSKKENEHQRWCGATVNEYKKQLDDLGISILEISKNAEYNLKEEIEKVNKSAHTRNWKAKLILFLKAVKKYGIFDIVAENNNQIVNNTKHHNYKTWSSTTVDKYIKMLNKLGINPITLSNNSKFDSLDSLYTLIKETAEAKYFDITDKELAPPVLPKQESKAEYVPRYKNMEF